MAAISRRFPPATIFPMAASAVLFIGKEGMLMADYGRAPLIPRRSSRTSSRPAATIPNSIGHHEELLRGVQDRRAHHLQLRLFRHPDRSRPARQRWPFGSARSSIGTRRVEVRRIAPRPTAFFAPTIAKAGPSNRPCRRRLPTPIATVQVAGGADIPVCQEKRHIGRQECLPHYSPHLVVNPFVASIVNV